MNKDRIDGRRLHLLGKAPLVLAVALIAGACGSSGPEGSERGGGDNEESSETGMVPVEIVLGWYPGSPNGGYFAGLQQGYFEDVGIDLRITGGPSAAPVQLVAARQAEFGIGDADEVLVARSQGIPIVGLFATYQKTPRILISHASNPVESFEDLDGREMFVDLGDTWWEWIKTTYQLEDVRDLEYSEQGFLQNENAVIQGYVGDVEKLNEVAPDKQFTSIDVGDSAWNPYSSMLFSSEEFIAENPDVVTRFTQALAKGWDYYRENYPSVNEFMQDFEPDDSAEALNGLAEVQQPYIFGEDGRVGYMSLDRWEETYQALIDVGVLEEDPNFDVSAAFSQEHMPA